MQGDAWRFILQSIYFWLWFRVGSVSTSATFGPFLTHLPFALFASHLFMVCM